MKVIIKPLPFFTIFIILYSFVNVIGFVNLPIYKKQYVNSELIYIYIVGISGLLVGSFFAKLIKVKATIHKGSFKNFRFEFYIYIINIISFLSILFLHLKNGGIILFNESTRYSSFFVINVLVYASIILNITFISNTLLNNKPLTKKILIFIFLQSILVISMGYRSPLIILFGCIGIAFLVVRNKHQNKYKKVFTIRNILYFILFIYIMTSISSFRRAQKYSFRKYYRNINMNYVDNHPYLKAFVPTISLLRYNQWVVTKLIENTKNNHLKGELYLSNFGVLLPGSHLGARNITGQIIKARKMPNGKPWSITPTLQGALFVDGGYNLVFFGFFLIALISGVYEKHVIKNPTPFNVTIYSFIFISFLMSIHTGYLDFMFYLLLLGVSFFKFIIMRIKKVKI